MIAARVSAGIAACFFLAVVATSGAACVGGPGPLPSELDPSTGTAADSAACCPPDEHPNCCMKYGGVMVGSGCGATCDGMPMPSDPGWKLGTDSAGCPVWTHPNDQLHGGTTSPDVDYCGGRSKPRPTDASTAAE